MELEIVVYYIVAALLFWVGIAMGLGDGGYHPSRAELAISISIRLLFILAALLLTFRIAWLFRVPQSDQSKGRSLRLTLPLSLGAVSLGPMLLLVSLTRC